MKIWKEFLKRIAFLSICWSSSWHSICTLEKNKDEVILFLEFQVTCISSAIKLCQCAVCCFDIFSPLAAKNKGKKTIPQIKCKFRSYLCVRETWKFRKESQWTGQVHKLCLWKWKLLPDFHNWTLVLGWGRFTVIWHVLFRLNFLWTDS